MSKCKGRQRQRGALKKSRERGGEAIGIKGETKKRLRILREI